MGDSTISKLNLLCLFTVGAHILFILSVLKTVTKIFHSDVFFIKTMLESVSLC